MRVKKALLALPLLLVLLVLLYLYSGRPGQRDAAQPPRTGTVGVAPLAAAPQRHMSVDGWLSNPAAMPHVPKFDPGLPLSEQIDQLMATKSPFAAYRAYLLVQSCIEFADKGELLRYDQKAGPPLFLRGLTPEERKNQITLCSGMTERIKTSRLDHLTSAARAGVMGADVALLRAGPFGDPTALKTRVDDPLVQQWKRDMAAMLATSAEAGSMLSIMTLADEYRDEGGSLGPDKALALRYTYATA